MRKVLWVTVCCFLSVTCTIANAMDGPHPKEHEYNHTMPNALKGANIALKTADGQAFQAYAVGAENAGKAIVVIHEWWGLNDHIREWTDKFAALGYYALAVDLYNGRTTTNAEEAANWMKQVNQTEANAKLRAAVETLKRKGRKIATIGWCFGGGQSLQASLQVPEVVDATVIYYGMPVMDVAALRTLRGPVLGIFALQDGFITPAVVKEFSAAMDKAGKSLEVHNYDAAHAFANPSGQRFNSAAAKQAWEVTQAFLAKNM
ncbi:MAG: dienelactone hydrolase family protein [Gammaproteobacteria bacterium]|nr:dienelactone hydrolase family protein [Gammaproteobacteria bacterium]